MQKRRNATITSESAADTYSRDTLPLLPRRIEEQLLHTVSFGNEARKLPAEQLNGTAEAAEEAIRQADKAAGILAQANLRLAIKHILTYRPDTTDEGWQDLIQRSYQALCHAAVKYDLRNAAAARYTTYAMFWVRQQTRHEFRKTSRMTGPDGRAVQSLDAPLRTSAEDGSFSLLDTISDPEAEAVFDAAEAEHDIATLLQLLPGREREAVALHRNVDGKETADGENRPYKEVGELMGGISGELARKIALTGMTRIRSYIASVEEPPAKAEREPAPALPDDLSEMVTQLDLFDL